MRLLNAAKLLLLGMSQTVGREEEVSGLITLTKIMTLNPFCTFLLVYMMGRAHMPGRALALGLAADKTPVLWVWLQAAGTTM